MTQNTISPDQIVNNSQPNAPDTLTAYYVVVKSSDDPTKPRQIIGWPTVQYPEGSTPSYTPADGYNAYLIEGMTDDKWQGILFPGGVNGCKAYFDGNIVDFTPTPASQPLKQQAQSALSSARVYVQNNFILLGETPSQPWIDYQKALIAIENGTDTKSTTLPTAPAS